MALQGGSLDFGAVRSLVTVPLFVGHARLPMSSNRHLQRLQLILDLHLVVRDDPLAAAVRWGKTALVG